MNDLNRCEARKIYKRIELKLNNLKIYLPEINFLQFIEELEKFQQLIEGIDSAGQTTQVRLPLARARFESLQANYKSLLKVLSANAKSIEKYSDESLLYEFFEAIHKSKLFINKCSQKFCTQISVSTNCIYNIATILKIYDLLYNLRSDLNIVCRNFDNLKNSTEKKDIKEVLASLYTRALASCHLKYNSVASHFPKFGRIPLYQLKFKVYKSKMSEHVETLEETKAEYDVTPEPVNNPVEENVPEQKEHKDEAVEENAVPEENTVVQENPMVDDSAEKIETTSHINEKNAEDPKPSVEEIVNQVKTAIEADGHNDYELIEISTAREEEQQPAVADEQQEDTDHVKPSSKTSLEVNNFKLEVQLTPTTSDAKIKQELFTDLENNRHIINETLIELHNLENKLKEINKEISHRRYTYKKQFDELETQKRAITENMNLAEDERTKHFQDLVVQIGQLSGHNKEILQNLEAQKNDTKNLSLVQAQKLNTIKQFLYDKQQENIQNFEKLEKDTTDSSEKEKIQKAKDLIRERFESELKIFNRFTTIDEFEVDDLGVYFIDKHNKKTYLTSVGDEHHHRLQDSRVQGSINEIGEECVSKETTSTSCNRSTSCHTSASADRQVDMSTESSRSSTRSEQREPLPLDSENYIKCTLGKPLRQALAAITVYQPSDPINYLANYLLQYRYNELRNIQRQQDFEDLVIERERYSKNLELDLMRHEKQIKKCDPCSLQSTKY